MGILKIANLTKKKTSSITKTGTMQPEKSPSTAAPAAPVVTGSQAAYVQLNEALKEAQARSYENPYEAAALQLAQPARTRNTPGRPRRPSFPPTRPRPRPCARPKSRPT